MTIRRTHAPARTLALTVIAASLAGCGAFGDGVDYRSAQKAPPLEVPPDLTQLERDNRYSTDEVKGVVTASGMQAAAATGGVAQAGSAPAAAAPQVGPVSSSDVRIERDGDQRWLVVRRTPEQLWPQLKQFWEQAGFEVKTEEAKTGVMETEWRENRSKIPQDFIRGAIGKVADNAYSTGERDKFRTRLERGADGTTEVYISHRGAQEVYTGADKATTAWQVRPNDPGLEAEYLAKLVASLTRSDEKAAQATVQGAPERAQHARLVGDVIELDEGYDRAWRRVGLALDRVGFTVEDRDRVQGVYYVRYIDPEVPSTRGFFSRLFTRETDEEKAAQRYRVAVKADGAEKSGVTVQDKDGKAVSTPTSAKMLKLLADELK